MTAPSSRLSRSFQRLAGAALAVAGLAATGTASAGDFLDLRPGTVYAAANLNLLQANGYECEGSPICERPRIGGKLFGGYRFTPNLATEVAYYYLGSFKSVDTGVTAPGDAADTKLRNTAVSIGIDWHNELFQVLYQHIRFGVAVVRTDGRIIYGDNRTERVNEYTTVPYLGLGLSYQFNPHVRFYQGYDILRNKRNNHIHVLSMGVGIEN